MLCIKILLIYGNKKNSPFLLLLFFCVFHATSTLICYQVLERFDDYNALKVLTVLKAQPFSNFFSFYLFFIFFFVLFFPVLILCSSLHIDALFLSMFIPLTKPLFPVELCVICISLKYLRRNTASCKVHRRRVNNHIFFSPVQLLLSLFPYPFCLHSFDKVDLDIVALNFCALHGYIMTMCLYYLLSLANIGWPSVQFYNILAFMFHFIQYSNDEILLTE